MEQEHINPAAGTDDAVKPKFSPAKLKQTLEALLFVAGKPFRAKDFAKILELGLTDVKTALDTLVLEKKDAGIILLENNGEYQLSTNSACSTQVKNFLNSELREKLTDATVEVLAIIAYRQPISKAEIEAIRGVNSQYSLRSLLMRGLIEKITNPQDGRSFLYQTTTELLMHMGMASVSELPEFAKLVEHIKLPQTPGLGQEPSLPEDAPKEDSTISSAPVLMEAPMEVAEQKEPQTVLEPEETVEVAAAVEETEEEE